MSKPVVWVRYTGKDFDVGNAVKISEDSDKTVVLLARSKVEGDKGSVLLFGDFIVGETCATVCSVHRVFKVEDFEVLLAPDGYFQWVQCHYGYVPKFAVCGGSSLLDHEPFFAGRVKELSGDVRGGSIVPSHDSCFVPSRRSPVPSDVESSDDEAEEKTAVDGAGVYDALQLAPSQWTDKKVPAGLVIETMDEDKVLAELAQLFKQHFHGRSQVKFHDAISKLWTRSGLDADFFFPQALPWLLDLARVHGLPSCFRQCLQGSLETRELTTEKQLCEGIKLARLFKHSAMDGFHEKTGQIGSRDVTIVGLFGLEPTHFDCLEEDWNRRGKVKQRMFADFLQTIYEHRIPSVDADETRKKKIMSNKERKMESMKRKSLLPPSRPPVAHSVMVQRQEEYTDVGIQLDIEEDQMMLEFEVPPPLSQSQMGHYDEQVKNYLETTDCTAQIAAVMETLVTACQRQQKMMTQTDQPAVVDGQHEQNQVRGLQGQVVTLHKTFSTLLTSDVSYTSDLINSLYPLLDQYVTNEWGGTLTPKEMSDLLVLNELKPQVVPDELKTLLAKSFILSLYNHSEDAAVFSKVENRVFDFLVAHATSNNNGDNNLLLPLTWILTHSPTSPDQLGPTIFSTLTEFLKNMTEVKFLENDSTLVISILKLFRDKCRTYSADTIQMMGKYLGSGSNQTGRIYSAQWLKLAAMKTDTHLDQPTLTILSRCLDDSNLCIKYNARAAFATEINKQTDQWTAETFPYAGILTDIISTEPIILTLAGEKPQYFTHSINTPILRILNYYRIQQRKSQWKVTKCVGKLFGKYTKPQETLSPGWEDALKEGLKYLSKQAQAIPKSVFEAVGKVFVEQDNSSVLPDCARFISECANKRQLDSEYITMSPQFLEQLCRRLRLSPSETHRRHYFECLHTLRVWQELPDDIFRVYHIEAGTARLLSVIQGGTKKKLVAKLGMNVPADQGTDVTQNILAWMEISLRRGFFLTPGIIEAYSKSSVANEIKAGLTAAANNGQVIPQDILSKALEEFPTLTGDKKDVELARACLKNQSLPDQVLKNVWKYLNETEQVLKSGSKEESCLILMCASFLLNRNLPKSDNHEALISELYEKFISPDARRDERLQELKDLFSLAMERLEKNTQEIPAPVANKSQGEQQDFQEFIEKAVKPELNILWDSESLQRLIVLLRSSSPAREFLEQTLSELDPWATTEHRYTCLMSNYVDIVPFARAAFLSMVTSSTETVAVECGRILALICNKFGQHDSWLGTVVVTLERMQTLGITLFNCVEKLLTNSSVEPLKAEQITSLFNPSLDGVECMKGFSKYERKVEPPGSDPLGGDLVGELLVAAYKKVICGKSALSEATVELLLGICMHSACFTYNCPAPVLMQCVERYIIAHSTIFSLSDQMNEGALTDLVYSSVVSSLAATIRPKISGHDSSSTCSHYRESILVLAAELLEAFHSDLPKLNSFLSKLSKVNMDTMWKIIPALYSYSFSKLDFSRFDIRDDNYEIEPEVEAILAGIATERTLKKDPSLRQVLALGLKAVMRQGYSFKHFLCYAHVAEFEFLRQIQAALRLALYSVDPFDLETVQLVRSARKYDNDTVFFPIINHHIQNMARKRPQMTLSLNDLIRKLITLKGNMEALTESILFSKLREVEDQRDKKEIQLGLLTPKKSVNSLTLEDIKDWSDFVRGKKIDPVEAICVASRAVKLWRSWDLTIVQISAILLVLSQTNERNLFMELSTGSGKSVVIAVIAAVKALEGNKVDTFTSNHLLAQRDAQEWKEFYNFFNLSCSSNGDGAVTYRKGFKECYAKDVVYGDIKQFQFDALRTEFLGLDTRAGRPYHDVIIDEVDSILLDEGSKLAMLSTAFTAMDKLEPIYHLIRSKLIHFDSQQTYFSRDGALYLKHDNNGDTKEGKDLGIPRREHLMQNLKDFIHNLLVESGTGTGTVEIVNPVKLPPHLLKYAKSQVSNWAEAAITAEALEENKDYLVVDNKVVPIDPHSGVLQPSSNWTNGLHQFLQIKHQVDFTPESPTTNYLSNIAMVKKYKHGFIGLTGTLGSRNSHGLLSEHFKADCIPIPDLYPSRFTQFQNIIVRTRQEWRETIKTCLKAEINLNRGVLVICETLKQAQGLHLTLSKSMEKTTCQIKLYVRSDNWMEHHLQQIQPRDVIITTNLGTRGMDIQASAIEAAGGLHVILAYMPPNTRIVRQAFGRTSRKGNVGSGQFKAETWNPRVRRCYEAHH